jgi:hypothetical protein
MALADNFQAWDRLASHELEPRFPLDVYFCEALRPALCPPEMVKGWRDYRKNILGHSKHAL